MSLMKLMRFIFACMKRLEHEHHGCPVVGLLTRLLGCSALNGRRKILLPGAKSFFCAGFFFVVVQAVRSTTALGPTPQLMPGDL